MKNAHKVHTCGACESIVVTAPEKAEGLCVGCALDRPIPQDAAQVRKQTLFFLKVGAHCQGGHSDDGLRLALRLDVPFPLSMPALCRRAQRMGLDPLEVWPWLPADRVARFTQTRRRALS